MGSCRTSVVDERRSGRPKDAASSENIQTVNDLLNQDRRMIITHITDTTGITSSTVHRIISDDLQLNKVSARWVPRKLTEEQKKFHVDICTDLLSRLQVELQTFLDRIVTKDETWVHHFDPETK